jgi:predicted nucleic-acid-binding protein
MDMAMIDANIILRIILNDDAAISDDVWSFIENNNIFIKNEVLAEVVYVLLKVYHKERAEISEYILQIITAGNVSTESPQVISLTLKTFETENLDFVDCLLYAYNKILGYKIYTLDKKLNKFLKLKEMSL